MFNSKLRLLGVSALVGAGLIAAGPADAFNLKLGSIDLQIDTSMTVGGSWKADDTNTHHLSLGNGGNTDNRPVVSLLGAAGAIAANVTPAAAVAVGGPANLGTASNKSADCGTVYTTVCMTLGDSEAGALNGIAGLSAGDEGAASGGPINYDSSVNGDDGRLNFEQGDMFSGTAKFLTEIEGRSGNFRGFIRLTGFYDAILDDDDSFNRSTGGILSSGRDDAVSDLRVLDAFVDYDASIGSVPVLVRVGSQVINWGESTFFLGGNSVFNPIDVPAIRRPGAEIKDALLPVEAAYISASLTDSITVEAYYGGHDGYKLDVGGTHFANSDNLVVGSGQGGNNGVFLVGGGPDSGSNKFNFDTTGVQGANAAGILLATDKIQDALAADTDHLWNGRDTDHPQHFTNSAPMGQLETYREGWEDTARIANLGELSSDESAQGLAVRYYAENLNSTEFGFYYQKYTSRIPYVGYRANSPSIGISTTGATTSATTLGLQGTAACGQATFNLDGNEHQAAFSSALAAELTIGNTADDDFRDPYGAWGLLKTAAQATYGELATTGINRSYHTSLAATLSGFFQTAAGGGMDAATADMAGEYHATMRASRDAAAVNQLTGAVPQAAHDAGTTDAVVAELAPGATAKAVIAGMVEADALTQVAADALLNTDGTYLAADFTNDQTTGGVWLTVAGIGNPTGDSFKNLIDAQCLLGIDNRLADGANDADWYGDYGINGAMQAAVNYSTDLFTYYPDDIEVFGASFNTTLLGWGIQGEVTSRPDFPLLVDTDSSFIAAAIQQCALPLIGDAGMAVYAPLVTRAGNACDATVGDADIFGHVEQDVYNWDIGTTATFTRSNPVVAALRADLGVLLTEFGGVSVPDIEETYWAGTGTSQVVDRLQGICTGGSDLPLGGLLDLDAVAPNSCRPTENSYGGLILLSLQYNNVFGSPWSLTPTFIQREGFHGYSPSPAGSFRDGVGSWSLSVRADLQGYLSVTAAFTDLYGDQKYTKSEDQDFASLSVNYAF